MSTLRPRQVAPDDLDAPFWDACAHHQFLVHRCTECKRAYWPASTCIDHGSAAMRWELGSGRGEVHTFTVVHHAYSPEYADRLPYAFAVVQLDEGPFFHTDIVGCPPEAVHIGLRVHATYPEVDGTVIPRFTPDTAPPANPSADNPEAAPHG